VLQSAVPTLTPGGAATQVTPQMELWIPPDLADQLVPLVQRDLGAAFGDDWIVDVSRVDYLAWGDGASDPLGPIRLVLTAVAVVILLLGALSLLNISLVTVRQRVREIGVRRSFGATAGRVFFAVMMESVVATVVAGVVGVFAAVILVTGPWTVQLLPVSDMPPFPLDAALIGLGAATLVGALAGLVPALVAVRVKVIDAIRF
jgi:putative ABC transport system permease protein